MKHFKPCNKCKDGYIYIEFEGDFKVKRCNCLSAFLQKRELEIALNKADIPLTIINYSIKDYVGEDNQDNIRKLKIFVKNYAEKFNDKVLYLYGLNGTQKTTLSWWIGRELIKKDVKVKYLLMNELVKNLINENYKEESDLYIKELNECDLLIIDESFDKEKVLLYNSKYQISFLDTFLRKRIERDRKCTIFVSNCQVESIEDEGFGRSIYSLIKRNTLSTQFYFYDCYLQKDNFEIDDLFKE